MSRRNTNTIQNILVISLSNIGDVIMTFPVLDILRRDFPQAALSVVVGPKAAGLLNKILGIDQVIIYDKKQGGWAALKWVVKLRRQRFDMAVDLRNSAIPVLAGIPFRTAPILKRNNSWHMRQQHLNRLKSLHNISLEEAPRIMLETKPDVSAGILRRIKVKGLSLPLVVICPGAADQAKRWSAERFATVCQWIKEHRDAVLVLIGDEKDREITDAIVRMCPVDIENWAGELNLAELSVLFQKSSFVLTNDSGPMHLASYADAPVLALFGPTDPVRYGPWSRQSRYLRRQLNCPRCNHPRREIPHQCMEGIQVNDVLAELKSMGFLKLTVK